MTSRFQPADVLIVGAGMSGLAAASSLHASGFQTLVIDKSRKIGGRLASKKVGTARFDYGAQFMTAREPQFKALLQQCENLGLIKKWFTSGSGGQHGHPRWCGLSSMTAVAEHLAASVRTHLDLKVEKIDKAGDCWLAHTSSGEALSARALLLTPPVPQIRALLRESDLKMSTDIASRLEHITYEKCLAVLAQLKGPSRVDPPGAMKFSDGNISWLADNQQKGISSVPALTIHGSAAFSEEYWHADQLNSGGLLVEAAEPWLGSGVDQFQVHRWRYAKPIHIEPERCLVIDRRPPLVLAGDGFGGPRVEGAAMSGWHGAAALADMLSS